MDSNFKLLVGTKVEDDIQSQLNKFPKKTIVITPILNKEGLQVGTKEIANYVSKTGDMAQVTKEFNKDGTEMSKTLTKVGETTKGVSKNISETSKHTSDLGGKFLDITKKVVAFGAVTAIIGAFTKSMSDAIEVTKEFDGSLAELRKVSDLSGEGLQEYTEDSFKMSRELSTTASTVTDAVALFVQAGYDLEQAKGLAKYSIMLQAIADHSMDTETATNFLTSTIKAFNMTAEDSEKIINSVNETSNKYAITSNDLTENLGKVAGVAGTAGVEFEQLLGLMVSSVEKTRNASKSANAFLHWQILTEDSVSSSYQLRPHLWLILSIHN